MTRRDVLGLAIGGAVALGACGGEPHHGERVAYGPEDSQFFELSRPVAGGSVPVVVLLHGGFWSDTYGLELMRPLVPDLLEHGWAVANVEYRRLGELDAGWPGTFADVAAAIDALRTVPDLDRSRVVALGHSAGGQLAVWAAGRGVLPPEAVGALPAVELRGAVAQAGVLDLGTAADDRLGGGAVTTLLGGGPDVVPEVYRRTSPIELLPIDVPIELLHDPADPMVPFQQSEQFAQVATANGDQVTLTAVPGGHFELIEPPAPAWELSRDAVGRLLR